MAFGFEMRFALPLRMPLTRAGALWRIIISFRAHSRRLSTRSSV
jgi:hypothetical protein